MARDRYTRDIDRGQDFIIREAKNIKGSYVKVGLQGETGLKPHGEKDSKHTVVDIGVVHEFGTRDGTIPERSFIRSTHDGKNREWSVLTKALLGRILLQRVTADKALGIIGLRIQNDVKDKIKSNVPPPSTRATLRRKLAKTAKGSKGKPVTLIDKGQMLNSIIFAKFMS